MQSTALKQDTPSPHTAVAALEAVVEEVVGTMGFETVGLELHGRPGQRVVRVFLDRPDSNPDDKTSGITIADCARMSPIIGNALDAAEADTTRPEGEVVRAILAGRYTLEVSSPGIERPLSKRGHFTRFAGRRVIVKTHEPIEADSKQKTFHGIVQSVEADPEQPDDERRGTIGIKDADGDAVHRIAMTQIKRANLVHEG